MRLSMMAVLCLGFLPSFVPCAQSKERKFPPQARDLLAKADKLVVYSLEPDEGDEKDKKASRLYGWKVLGKTAVKRDGKTGKELLAALDKALVDGAGARCFLPRHAIRAEHKGKTVDVLICFECYWVEVHFEGEEKGEPLVHIDDSLQPLLDQILQDANIPLAKKER